MGYSFGKRDPTLKMQNEKQSLCDLWITCAGINPGSVLACGHTATRLPSMAERLNERERGVIPALYVC